MPQSKTEKMFEIKEPLQKYLTFLHLVQLGQPL